MIPVASRQAGLSLVEMMMAIFIMALATSLVLMTLPPRPSRVEVEGARLVGVIERAANQAMISGHLTGLDVTEHGYALVRRRNNVWQVIQGTTHELPEEMSILYESATGRKVPDDWPEARFDPIGQTEAAEIILTGEAGRSVLSLNEAMKIAMVHDER